MNETIVAIATPLGKGAISIVKISGNNALSILKQLTKKQDFTPRYAYVCDIFSNDILLDKALALYFKAPYSFTGEDVCEIQCHGNPLLTQNILQVCLNYGARLAKPGEFSKRAFLNHKMDLSEVEASVQLILCEEQSSLNALARQLKGELKIFIEDARNTLLKLLASSEVLIDYSEEDIPSDFLDEVSISLEAQIACFKDLLDFSNAQRERSKGHALSIIGKPNAGKSSLLNAMLLEERALVSDIQGTTRDTIEEVIELEGHKVRLIDTAGIRETTDKIERLGVEKSLKSLENCDIILSVFDISKPLEKEDFNLIDTLNRTNKPCIIILNKNDLSPKLELETLKSHLKISYSLLETNTLDTRTCLKDLSQKISEFFPKLDTQNKLLLTSTAQKNALENAINELQNAREHLETLELFSYHILSAIENLNALTRPYETSQMLDSMFSEFCLGK
ncbi:tRNA uridine-5-carboxymethylaminomethyl(34) synthesis GTPase MnmE [Helicobacter cetorum]|uniref:tRNA modification GTPase MnmE n=1 Tax=Helicobacter cetorum (strain ATCC BAA-540 / CCUG 52418 / MIT 99-5656) TaxID=1163745 RepID=I0EQH8_HELCM|nr:tRNA uridine-5-carboxymethylaminomethyl(34) synthesis GTPase MnmE [Helicobacter cetorum]AFI05197.1 tRNA modification GTPase TrmE [Helicobacter cetorum MIT 99-5656]